MKNLFRYGFILAFICVIASALLASVHSLTEAKIIAQAQNKEDSILKEVIPEAERFLPVKSGKETLYYKAYSQDDKLMGMAFKASGKGYSSTIDTMVGMSIDGTITAIKILNQNETPGLGNRIGESLFAHRFSRKNISRLNEVQGITGATISSKAVIDSVKKRAEEIKGLIDNIPKK